MNILCLVDSYKYKFDHEEGRFTQIKITQYLKWLLKTTDHVPKRLRMRKMKKSNAEVPWVDKNIFGILKTFMMSIKDIDCSRKF